MKKVSLFFGFLILSICGIQAQDSTNHNTSAQNHKKAMHRESSTMTPDSVNAGKITTNPNGKTGSESKTIKRRKTAVNSSKNSKDSIR